MLQGTEAIMVIEVFEVFTYIAEIAAASCLILLSAVIMACICTVLFMLTIGVIIGGVFIVLVVLDAGTSTNKCKHDWEQKGWNCQQDIRRCRVCGRVELQQDLNYCGQGDWGDEGHTITWREAPSGYWER
jgi:hypothetical protein